MVYLVQILYTYVFKHCSATDMQKGNEASSSIILAIRALLVKMIITLEPHCIFGSNWVHMYLELCGIFYLNSVYYCILTLSNRW